MIARPVLDRLQLAALGLLSLAAVGIALVSQHRFDMQPCPWCVMQRILYVAIGIVALLAAAWPSNQARRLRWRAALLMAVLATLGAASALWQQLYAAKSASCNRTMADILVSFTRLDRLLPDVFEPRASCAEAAVNLLGLPYAVWSLLLFLLLAVSAAKLHLEQRSRVLIPDRKLDHQPA